MAMVGLCRVQVAAVMVTLALSMDWSVLNVLFIAFSSS
jgi:hypothetical protein